MRDAGEAVGAAIQAIARAPEMLERIDQLTDDLRQEQQSLKVAPSRLSGWQALPLWLLAAAAIIALLR